MDNSRFLKIVIIILLLVNIGTLSFMWLQRPGGMPPPPHPNGPAAFLTRELNLSADQTHQYDQMRNEHRRMMEDLRDSGRLLHERFFRLLENRMTDSALVNQLADSIALNEKQIDLITFTHFKAVRAICTPDQQAKFDVVIREALKMMATPAPPVR